MIESGKGACICKPHYIAVGSVIVSGQTDCGDVTEERPFLLALGTLERIQHQGVSQVVAVDEGAQCHQH